MMDTSVAQQLWKDNDVEIHRLNNFSPQFNTEMERFMVTIKSPKTEMEEKQKRLIEVLKLYNAELKDRLDKVKGAYAKKEQECKTLVISNKDNQATWSRKEQEYEERIKVLNQKL